MDTWDLLRELVAGGAMAALVFLCGMAAHLRHSHATRQSVVQRHFLLTAAGLLALAVLVWLFATTPDHFVKGY
jgi:hypothetical protein